MFLYGMKLYVFKHLILCSNFSTFKYNDSVDTNIYLQAHGAEQNIKSNSNTDQVDTSHPEQFIQANQKESTSNKRAEKKSK